MIDSNVEPRKSNIEGMGLFATKKIKKGEYIDTGYKEKPDREVFIFNDEEFKQFQEKCIADGKKWDSVTLNSGVHKASIADRKNNPSNYGNHSCEPNTEVKKDGAVATRDIEPGEEVTSDYSLFSDKNWSMVCNCHSKNCKKNVRGKI